MKIKSKNSNVVSTKLIVPIDGLITIDSNGEADVSVKCALLLVKNTNDWNYSSKVQDTNTKVDEKTKTDVIEKVDEKNERQIFEEKIKSAKLADLKEMCSEAKLPEEEYKNLSKSLLILYILKKYDEASISI